MSERAAAGSLAELQRELAELRRKGIECCDCDGLSDEGDCECACHRLAALLGERG